MEALLTPPPCVYAFAMSLWVILFVCAILGANVTMLGGASKSAASKKSVFKTPSAKQQSAKLPGEQSPLKPAKAAKETPATAKQSPAKASKEKPATACRPAAPKPAAKKLAAETHQKEKLSERECTRKPQADDAKVPHASRSMCPCGCPDAKLRSRPQSDEIVQPKNNPKSFAWAKLKDLPACESLTQSTLAQSIFTGGIETSEAKSTAAAGGGRKSGARWRRLPTRGCCTTRSPRCCATLSSSTHRI